MGEGLNPNSIEDSLPDIVTRQLGVAGEGGRKPSSEVHMAKSGFWSATPAERNCAPDNCTGVSNASDSLSGPQEGPRGIAER